MKNLTPAQPKKSTSVIKSPVKKKAAKATFRPEKTIIKHTDSGYATTEHGVIVPKESMKSHAISPSKLQQGILSAQKQINKTIKSIADIFNEDLTVSEIELTLGFDAKGNFMGFGAGTNFSIKVKVRPNS